MIVIPMAGASSRFSAAGYRVPKFELDLNGASVFAHAVSSFKNYFGSEEFIFIAREGVGVERFVHDELERLGVKTWRLVTISSQTRGQAETVALGLGQCEVPDGTPVLVFNIDTFRPNFVFPDCVTAGVADGYLEVFLGSGANWSYVKASRGGGDLVDYTTEKRPVSNLCCTGMYYFGSYEIFRSGFDAFALDMKDSRGGELYVAPMYNYLIQSGLVVRYGVIENSEVFFCGVPEEYEYLKKSKYVLV
jgi:hypothetical protein